MGTQPFVCTFTVQERELLLREGVLKAEALHAKIEASRSLGKWSSVSLTVAEAEDLLAQAAAADLVGDREAERTLVRMTERVEELIQKQTP